MHEAEYQFELFSDLAAPAPVVVDALKAEGPADSVIVKQPSRKITLPPPVKPDRPSPFLFPEGFNPAEGDARAHLVNNLAALRLRAKLNKSGEQASRAEKLALSKYIGWGGLSSVFSEYEFKYAKVRVELEKLVGAEGIEAFKASTLNAHYTSRDVVRFVWACLRRAGFNGGRVIEPAVGTGNFIGGIPADIAPACYLTAVELEPVTADLAKLIYGSALTVHQCGFQDAPIPDNYFDLAISNVPFGEYTVSDRSLPKARIHDYFFLKAMQKVRPGGLIAFLTSAGTFDKQNDAHRRYLAQRAELVAAFRLPSCAFEANAHTEVTTDLIILRRREVGANLDDVSSVPWVSVKDFQPEGTYSPIPVNNYYLTNPAQVLGDLKANWRRGATCELPVEDFPARLKAAVELVPVGIYAPSAAPVSSSGNVGLARESDRNGAFALDGEGRLCVNRHGLLSLYTEGAAASHKRIRGMLSIRNAARKLLEATGLDDSAGATAAREELNDSYDRFRKEFGLLNGQTNSRLFRNDPEAPLLLALENYDPENEEATTKAALFLPMNLRRMTVADGILSSADALAACLNRHGRVEANCLAELTGKTWPTVWAELNGTLLFRDPVTNEIETAEVYLSGDVRKKLAAAQTAAAHQPEFAPNVDALRAVQPAEIAPDQISGTLGASWIPAEYVEAFLGDLLDIRRTEDRPTVQHLPALGTWRIAESFSGCYQVANTTRFGTGRMPAIDLVEHALNLRLPAVYD